MFIFEITEALWYLQKHLEIEKLLSFGNLLPLSKKNSIYF